jgi:hypothetical protein
MGVGLQSEDHVVSGAGRARLSSRAMSRLVSVTVGTVVIVLGGCSTAGPEVVTSVMEAQDQATAEFREVVALDPQTWSGATPQPVPNDCTANGHRGVQFTYFTESEKPSNPRSLVRAAARRWKDEGYRIEEVSIPVDAETGDISAVTARAAGKPSASMAGTTIRAHLYVNSVCVRGDPDSYR